MGASEKLAEALGAVAAQVAAGETVHGALVANEAKTFGGGMRAVVVTDDRLIVQPVDRKWQTKGEALVLTAADIADLRVSGLGDDWYNTAISLVANSGFELRLKTTSGQKLKLMFMSGEGGLLGSLGGGETQARGVAALAEWLHKAGGH